MGQLLILKQISNTIFCLAIKSDSLQQNFHYQGYEKQEDLLEVSNFLKWLITGIKIIWEIKILPKSLFPIEYFYNVYYQRQKLHSFLAQEISKIP